MTPLMCFYCMDSRVILNKYVFKYIFKYIFIDVVANKPRAIMEIMNYYGLTGFFTAQAGKRDELAEILLQAAELLRRNEDCLHYVVSVVADDEERVWVNEVWSSKEAHAASLSMESVQELIMSARPLIAGMTRVAELEVRGGKMK